MKKTKRFWTIALLTGICLVGCGKGEETSSVKPTTSTSLPASSTSTHTHTFDTDWHKDATGHWHECTVDHTKSTVEKHTFGDWTTVKAATHTEEGLEKRVCSVCQYEETRKIDKLAEHTFDTDWHKDATGHWHECTVDHEKSAVEEHNFGDVTVTKAPTYEEEGTGTKTCTECGYVENVTIPKKETKDFFSYEKAGETNNEALVGDDIKNQELNHCVWTDFGSTGSSEVMILSKAKYKNVTNVSFDAKILGENGNGKISSVDWFGLAHSDKEGFDIYSHLKTTGEKTTGGEWKTFSLDTAGTFSADGDYIGLVWETGKTTFHDIVLFDNVVITTSDGQTYKDDFENKDTSLFTIKNFPSIVKFDSTKQHIEAKNNALPKETIKTLDEVVIDHTNRDGNTVNQGLSLISKKEFKGVSYVQVQAEVYGVKDLIGGGDQNWWGIKVTSENDFYPGGDVTKAFSNEDTSGVTKFEGSYDQKPMDGKLGFYLGLNSGIVKIKEIIIVTSEGNFDYHADQIMEEFDHLDAYVTNKEINTFDTIEKSLAAEGDKVYSDIAQASSYAHTETALNLESLKDKDAAYRGTIEYENQSGNMGALILGDDTENKEVTYLALGNNEVTLYKNATKYETITIADNKLTLELLKDGTLTIDSTEGKKVLAEKVTSIVSPRFIGLYGSGETWITSIDLNTHKA